MSETREEQITKNPLINKKIAVCPVIREGGWLSHIDSNHDGKFLFTGAGITIKGLVYDMNKRHRENPLTPEEQAFFESREAGLGLKPGDLSVYVDKGWWSKFQMKLGKDPFVLDLSDPMDYLRYKFLMAQVELIAPNWGERFEKGTYKYAFKDDDAEAEEKVSTIDREIELMDHLKKIRSSERKLRALLTVYYAAKNTAKKVPANATKEFLTNEVHGLIKSDPATLESLIKDQYYNERVLVSLAIEAGAINKLGASEYQIVGEEDKLNMRELLEFLNAKKNQLVRSKIEAQLELQKK